MPCDSCAYTEGAEANQEPNNAIKGLLCVLGGIPFYCHHLPEEVAGEPIRPERLWWTAAAARVTPAQLRDLGIPICAGWKREVAALAATGYYKDCPVATRLYAQIGLGQLEILCSKDLDEDDKEQAKRVMEGVFKRLVEKRSRFLKLAYTRPE